MLQIAQSVHRLNQSFPKYITASVDAELALEEVAKSEIIYHISHNIFEHLLTTGRNKFQESVKSRMQLAVNELNLGIRIIGVQIKFLEPPTSIKNAFDDVSSAQSEKQKVIQEAKGERGTLLSQARSNANKERSNAISISNERLQQAQGDMERFDSQLAALASADKLFVQRLYLENLDIIFSDAQLHVIAPDRTLRIDE